MRSKLAARLLLSLYAGLGFFLIAFMFAFMNPRIYDKIEQARRVYQYSTPPQIPPPELINTMPSGAHYPWGYYVCLFALVVTVAIFLAPRLLSLTKPGDNPFTRCISALIIFFILGLATSVNFHFDTAYIAAIISFGFVIGIIDGVRSTEIDFDFVEHQGIPRELRLQSLQAEYNKWFHWTMMFTAFLIAAGITGLLGSMVSHPRLIWNEVNIVYYSVLIYVGIGLGLGLYWEVMCKINSITEKIKTIR